MGNEKAVAILSYLLVGIIWYFVDDKVRKNRFATFHVKQGLILLIFAVGGSIVLGLIPILGWILLPFYNLFILVLWIFGIVYSASGKEKALPVIGGLGKKFKF
ncbi:MAG: DUF4870 domain-containing protein [Nanoarchaeota archaeon]